MKISGKQKKYIGIGIAGLVLFMVVGGILPFSLPGWEIGAGLYSVRIEDKTIDATGKRMIVYDPDGPPKATFIRSILGVKSYEASGYEYAKVWFGIQSDPTKLGVTGTFPETGRVERTVNGEVVECQYQVVTYEMGVRAYSLTSAIKEEMFVATPFWVTDAGISSDLQGHRGEYYANLDHFDIELSFWFEIDPWDYRVGDYVWGGILNAWVSDTDITPLAWEGYGDFGDQLRDSPAEADVWETLNFEVLEGEPLGGNWQDLAPDVDFTHKAKISVGGTMKQGADLKVGGLRDVTGIDICDIQMDWKVRLEVLVIHGWIPEEGEEEQEEHEHEQEQHQQDIWELFFDFLGSTWGWIITIILIVVFLAFLPGIIFALRRSK